MKRIIGKFNPGDVVGDVFGGVGPFAIPASKKNVIVLANDLNPESYKYLQENIKINKVEPFIKPFNLDGREFIRKHLNYYFNGTIVKMGLLKRKSLKSFN